MSKLSLSACSPLSIMQTALMAQVTNEGNQLQFYDPGNSISPLLPTMRASLHYLPVV